MQLNDKYDVLVVGSGVGGLSTAVVAAKKGLKVLVIEKSEKVGGTTARSGGWLWIPNTHLAHEKGIFEREGEAEEYIKNEAGQYFNQERVRAFLKNGPDAVKFFTDNTFLRFDISTTFPDYHSEVPGGRVGGRSMLTTPFDARLLGDKVKYLEPPLPELTVFGIMIGSGDDIRHFMNVFKSFNSFIYVTKRLSKHFFEVIKYGRGMLLTNGNALAGRLYKSALDLNVDIWTSVALEKLIYNNEKVDGAIIRKKTESLNIRVNKGIVLATGGFPYDIDRRRELFQHAKNGYGHYSPSSPLNTGDGQRAAEKIGAKFDSNVSNPAAWTPTSLIKRKDGSIGIMPHFIDRAKPGVIAVNHNGKRFTNEANSYHDFIQDMVKNSFIDGENACWLIADHRSLRKYGLGAVPPSPIPIRKFLRNGYLKMGDTLQELAKKINIPVDNLIHTINTFNKNAILGTDPEFSKGSTAYNRFQGDPLQKPNPCLAPIEKPPFYAIKLNVGDIGTFAGLSTNKYGQVLNNKGEIINGLFSVGNESVSIMGGNYPGAGITLGPGLVFGYIVGRYLAENNL